MILLFALLHWLFTALIIMLVAYITPGIYISGFGTALVVSLVMGLVNFFIRPVLSLLTLPLTILTLGLFAFILNAFLFALVAWIVPGFEVSNFGSALLGSLLLAIMTGILDWLSPNRSRFAS